MPLGILALRAFAYMFGRVHACPVDWEEPAAAEPWFGCIGSDFGQGRKKAREKMEGKVDARLRRF